MNTHASTHMPDDDEIIGRTVTHEQDIGIFSWVCMGALENLFEESSVR